MVTTTIVDAVAAWLGRRASRRSFLQRAAVVGSALSVSGLDFVLRPGTAYASICGDGASCYSGWTALCCTVNDGVNQCPPGSFAAGWWKADGAHLCGGKARYYIDCQAQCTKCRCPRGYHFCSERCWNCSAHCAKGNGCDERRVCHNVFRYGQCHQEIGCSGPVWCRVVSCTPPWQFEKCSKSSATDNATRSHSSSCLPSAWTPMQRRYKELGSQGSPLGASAGRERDGRHGTYQKFEHGRMYHSERTGSRYVLGALAVKYHQLGESGSPLGLPVQDTRPNPAEGRHNVFEHGAIHASASTGVHAVFGPIYPAWRTSGGDTGELGLPTTDTVTGPGGVVHNDFQHGAIYHHPVLGTHTVPEPVLLTWTALNRGTGPLGFPRADAVTDAAGVLRQDFEHGTVIAHPTLGVHAVWGPIYDAWIAEYGGPAGSLGYPTSDVYPLDPTHLRCDFEHGSLTLDTTTGTVSSP